MADSLSGLDVPELSSARRIADIGAGAGFPGLVLAIAIPRAQVDLVESAGRKTAVIDRLIQAAELGERALHNRARGGLRARAAGVGGGREAYDAVTARAVGPLAVLVEYAAPLLRAGGVLVAWKGARDSAEEAAGAAAAEKVGMAVKEVIPVQPYRGLRESPPARLPQGRAHAAGVPAPRWDGTKAPPGVTLSARRGGWGAFAPIWKGKSTNPLRAALNAALPASSRRRQDPAVRPRTPFRPI